MAKKTTKRGRTPGVNKKSEVVKALTDNPSLSPNEVSQKLAKQGIDVAAQYISNIKSQFKRQDGGQPQAKVEEMPAQEKQAPRKEQEGATKANGRLNKTQAIRDYLTANPKAMPKEAAEALTKKHGVKFTPGVISTSKYKMGKDEAAPKERAKPMPQVASKQQRSSTDLLNVDNLMAAKQLADQLGGLDKARQALEVLAKLVGTSA